MTLGIWDKAFFSFCPRLKSSSSLPSSLGINKGTAIGSIAISSHAVLGQWSYVAFGTGTV